MPLSSPPAPRYHYSDSPDYVDYTAAADTAVAADTTVAVAGTVAAVVKSRGIQWGLKTVVIYPRRIVLRPEINGLPPRRI